MALPAKLCVGPSPIPLFLALAAYGGAVAWLLDAQGYPPAIVAHGALMATAWGAMLPAGAAIARWRKVTRQQRFPDQLDNQFWWNRHRQLQHGGVALTLAGTAAILAATGGSFYSLHGQIGLGLVLLALAQVALSAARGSKGGPTDPAADPARPETWRGDHFDMTPRRILFERLHKAIGWGSIGAGPIVILLALSILGFPAPLMLLLALPYLALAAFAVLQAWGGRHVDTYVAIWGRLRSPLLRPGVVPPPGEGEGRSA
ncbi:cytochrome b family protein [Falsiroseomonas ponticola]|uniref:hypothetical protein n=1 Tax=Falsiroseomonas ponticola TaxID=2786951 RepID=UPI0019344BD9|nr:hypothetical protein [Roseomonas ponticola]